MCEANDILKKKINDSKDIIKKALEKFHIDDLAIAFTGGKDSTLLLHLIDDVCQENDYEIPDCFCINEGDMFPEVKDFIEEVSEKYDIEVEYIHNDDVSQAAGYKIGASVKVVDLNQTNKKEIKRLGFEGKEFPFEPESFVGNHLMKTVPLNIYLKENKIKGFFEGIRWDEQEARADEEYFSKRESTEYSPEHIRICPILHFTEKDVWDATFALDIPICSLYKKGYRSLGVKSTTDKAGDKPAWEQDLENTNERGGRRQDKEGVMKKLRDLGYM
ncbi:MAG: phosphoadenosine phosphosulfate reductase family protein [bacterium]